MFPSSVQQKLTLSWSVCDGANAPERVLELTAPRLYNLSVLSNWLLLVCTAKVDDKLEGLQVPMHLDVFLNWLHLVVFLNWMLSTTRRLQSPCIGGSKQLQKKQRRSGTNYYH